MRPLLLILAAAVAAVASGGCCCGLQRSLSPAEAARHWIGDLPVGTPSADAIALMKRKGFSVIDHRPTAEQRAASERRGTPADEAARHVLYGRRDLGPCLDYLLISRYARAEIQLDETGRVSDVRVDVRYEGP